MVAAGVEVAAAQPSGAGDREPVGATLDLGAETAKAVDDTGDPVLFLVAELLLALDHRLSIGEAAE